MRLTKGALVLPVVKKPLFDEDAVFVDANGNYIYPDEPHDPVEPKVMFEDAGWRITEPDHDNGLDPFDAWDVGGVTRVSHHCHALKWRAYVSNELLVTTAACQGCNEPVPDSVLTLWKLQNAKSLVNFMDMAEQQDFQYIIEKERPY
jgi:hypothetical protein